MTGRFVTLFVLLTFAGSMNGWQTAGSQSASPSLKETTEWLESHLVGIAHGSSTTVVTMRWKKGKPPKETDRQSTSTHETVTVAKFDGCSLIFGQLTKGDDYSVTTVSTVPLGRLTRASWKVQTFDPVRTEGEWESTETTVLPASVVLLKLEGSTSVIAYHRRSTGSVPSEWVATPFQGNSATLVIKSDDQEMSPRLVKAFNHAIELCRTDSAPEPF